MRGIKSARNPNLNGGSNFLIYNCGKRGSEANLSDSELIGQMPMLLGSEPLVKDSERSDEPDSERKLTKREISNKKPFLLNQPTTSTISDDQRQSNQDLQFSTYNNNDSTYYCLHDLLSGFPDVSIHFILSFLYI